MLAEYTYTCSHTLRRWIDGLRFWRRPSYLDFRGEPIPAPVDVAVDLRLCSQCRDGVLLDGWHIDEGKPCGEHVVRRGAVLVLGEPMEPDPA